MVVGMDRYVEGVHQRHGNLRASDDSRKILAHPLRTSSTKDTSNG